MAMQTIFRCQGCGFEVEAWDDGNPYIEGPDGTRHHFYHPSGEERIAAIVANLLGREPTAAEIEATLRAHSGNESDHLCLACGAASLRNRREARRPCDACGSREVADTGHLAGRRCPKCGTGTFDAGRFGAIS